MKKAILLLFVLCINDFVYSQTSTRQNDFAVELNAGRKSVEEVFIKFEDAVFTQSDKKGIITSYMELGKTQRELGHLEEASYFFGRAYVLAKDYYLSFPNENATLVQIKKKGQFMLNLLSLYLSPKENYAAMKENSTKDNPYLQQAEQHWADLLNEFPNNNQYQENLEAVRKLTLAIQNEANDIELHEQKVVASFFMAATEEPLDYGIFTLSKKTSLRKAATHKSRSLGRLAVGTKLNVLEQTNQYWWMVETGGTIGYVKALLLK